ncbi:hypothetical protein B0H17DRAFT_1201252 [Mycena rosella]|uniref:Uncharacterized protein n=1 Tax=Mycena rosella TaxID=1033263 RepID=A0AAD7DGY1_MYCRO|nr:hypothetical protein B0H17DRAFT_1201252 [Mycena rosella]
MCFVAGSAGVRATSIAGGAAQIPVVLGNLLEGYENDGLDGFGDVVVPKLSTLSLVVTPVLRQPRRPNVLGSFPLVIFHDAVVSVLGDTDCLELPHAIPPTLINPLPALQRGHPHPSLSAPGSLALDTGQRADVAIEVLTGRKPDWHPMASRAWLDVETAFSPPCLPLLRSIGSAIYEPTRVGGCGEGDTSGTGIETARSTSLPVVARGNVGSAALPYLHTRLASLGELWIAEWVSAKRSTFAGLGNGFRVGWVVRAASPVGVVVLHDSPWRLDVEFAEGWAEEDGAVSRRKASGLCAIRLGLAFGVGVGVGGGCCRSCTAVRHSTYTGTARSNARGETREGIPCPHPRASFHAATHSRLPGAPFSSPSPCLHKNGYERSRRPQSATLTQLAVSTKKLHRPYADLASTSRVPLSDT